MTDADFLQEILAHPDDDAPRLIYADWLEERGDPRGEFIRTQCELCSDPIQSSRTRKLRLRQAELLKSHEKKWLGPITAWVRKWEWRRGFVEFIEVSVRDFLKHAAEIFAASPVQRAFLRAGPRRMPALAACPHLARLRELSFNGTLMEDSGVSALVASPHLTTLTSLKVYRGGITSAGVASIAHAKGLSRLACLNLGGNHITNGMQAVAESDLMNRLTMLELPFASLNAEDIRQLSNVSKSSLLQTLDLSNNFIGPTGGQHLACRHLLANLAILKVSNCHLGDGGVAALAASAHVSSLEVLDLTTNLISSAGLQALAKSAFLERLTDLNLSYNEIDGQGLAALAASPLLSRLTRLNLCQNRISLSGVYGLLASTYWTGKTKLDLRRNGLQESAIADLQHRFGKSFGNFHRPFLNDAFFLEHS